MKPPNIGDVVSFIWDGMGQRGEVIAIRRGMYVIEYDPGNPSLDPVIVTIALEHLTEPQVCGPRMSQGEYLGKINEALEIDKMKAKLEAKGFVVERADATGSRRYPYVNETPEMTKFSHDTHPNRHWLKTDLERRAKNPLAICGSTSDPEHGPQCTACGCYHHGMC